MQHPWACLAGWEWDMAPVIAAGGCPCSQRAPQQWERLQWGLVQTRGMIQPSQGSRFGAGGSILQHN